MKGETCIQFDSVHCPRATFTPVWESSLAGIEECWTFANRGNEDYRHDVSHPAEVVWFVFERPESQMGYTSQQNQPLGVSDVAMMLELVLEEVDDQEEHVVREYMKFVAAAALAMCVSLRGNEVFLLDLAGLWYYIDLGLEREGKIHADPMKTGTEVSGVPNIIVTLIGEFKGELETKHRLIALASVTSSGIKFRWWLEELMRIQEKVGCKTGPAFGDSNMLVGLMSEYNNVLHFFL